MSKNTVDLNISGIYALKEGDAIRYVGQAKNIEKRFRQHSSLAQNRGNTKKQTWITQLLSNGGELKIEVLEATDDLDNAEVKWINQLRSKGANLVNLADGGKSMTHCNRAKQERPWGKSWSPVQRRLIEISQTTKMLRKFYSESPEDVARIEARLIKVNQRIKEVGLDKINYLLWEKYGY